MEIWKADGHSGIDGTEGKRVIGLFVSQPRYILLINEMLNTSHNMSCLQSAEGVACTVSRTQMQRCVICSGHWPA